MLQSSYFLLLTSYFLLSVSIVVRLVRPVDRHANVIGLVRGELRQLHPEMVEVQSRNLLIEMLREHVHLLFVLAGVLMKLELRDYLIGE